MFGFENVVKENQRSIMLIIFRLAVSEDQGYFSYFSSHKISQFAQLVQRNISTFSAENMKKFQQGSENPYQNGYGPTNLNMTTLQTIFLFIWRKCQPNNDSTCIWKIQKNTVNVIFVKSDHFLIDLWLVGSLCFLSVLFGANLTKSIQNL